MRVRNRLFFLAAAAVGAWCGWSGACGSVDGDSGDGDRDRAIRFGLRVGRSGRAMRWPTLPAGKFRHRDHRFEWTRAELRAWAEGVAGRYGYAVRVAPIGPADPEVGPPTQMAVFTIRDIEDAAASDETDASASSDTAENGG